MSDFGPLAFAWLRVLGSFLLLSAIVPMLPYRALDRPFDRSVLARCALYSVLGVVVNQLLFLSGLSRTSAHHAALLITTIPIFVLLAAGVLRMESITARKWSGITLACVGAVIIVWSGGSDAVHGSAAGNAMIIINCFSYALYLVLSRPLFQEMSSLRVLHVMFGIGVLLMLPFSWRALGTIQWSSVPGMSWLWLAVVVAGPTVGAYAINGWALRRADSSTVAIYTYLQPLFATILAALILDERTGAVVILAGLLIVGGVAVASSRPRVSNEAAAERSV